MADGGGCLVRVSPGVHNRMVYSSGLLLPCEMRVSPNQKIVFDQSSRLLFPSKRKRLWLAVLYLACLPRDYGTESHETVQIHEYNYPGQCCGHVCVCVCSCAKCWYKHQQRSTVLLYYLLSRGCGKFKMSACTQGIGGSSQKTKQRNAKACRLHPFAILLLFLKKHGLVSISYIFCD